MDERGSVPVIFLVNVFFLSKTSFLAVTQCLVFRVLPLFRSAGKYLSEVKLTAYLHLVPSQRRQVIRVGIPQLQSNQIRYIFYRITETIWPTTFPVCNSGILSVSSDSELPSKPSVNFMYLTIYTSTNYKYCITACLCVSYDSQNREKIFPYTAIAGLLF